VLRVVTSRARVAAAVLSRPTDGLLLRVISDCRAVPRRALLPLNRWWPRLRGYK